MSQSRCLVELSFGPRPPTLGAHPPRGAFFGIQSESLLHLNLSQHVHPTHWLQFRAQNAQFFLRKSQNALPSARLFASGKLLATMRHDRRNAVLGDQRRSTIVRATRRQRSEPLDHSLQLTEDSEALATETSSQSSPPSIAAHRPCSSSSPALALGPRFLPL